MIARHSARTRTDAATAVQFKDQSALTQITRDGYERAVLDSHEADMTPRTDDFDYVLAEALAALGRAQSLANRYGRVVRVKAEFFTALDEVNAALMLIGEIYPVRPT